MRKNKRFSDSRCYDDIFDKDDYEYIQSQWYKSMNRGACCQDEVRGTKRLRTERVSDVWELED